jgi:hypothetical protein
VDRSGVDGPTPGQARGPNWRQTSPGRYVPIEVDDSVVEQRILEQAHRIRGYGAVTAWASLRWQGAQFFDGTTDGGVTELPIPLISHTKLRPDPRFVMTQEQLAPSEWSIVGDIPVATIQRALFDEVRRRPGVRDAANAIAMAAAARLTSRRLFAMYVAQRQSWTGVPHARLAVALAHDDCRSPQEFRMYLVWKLDADLPEPLLNRAVYDLDGRLIGIPDLFDPVAGLAGEYQGGEHKDPARRRKDTEKADRYRDHGIEMFEVVEGELGRRQLVAARMRSSRARSKFLPPESCAWTLETPPWRTPPEPLDAYLQRIGRADQLWRT